MSDTKETTLQKAAKLEKRLAKYDAAFLKRMAKHEANYREKRAAIIRDSGSDVARLVVGPE